MFDKQCGAVRVWYGQQRQRIEEFYRNKLRQGKKLKSKAEATYRRYEKYLPIVAFVAGFAYDSLTLTRIDMLLDNLILLGYTFASGGLIVIVGLAERGRVRQPFLSRHLDWVTLGIHFFFGGLLSSYVVFYFKSAAVGKSYLFVGLLVALLLINEFWAHRLQNVKLMVAIYFFCSFAFLTFFLPSFTHVMNAMMFLASGFLSLLLIAAIWYLIFQRNWPALKRELLKISWPPILIFLALVIFYFQNWMPPVPLALKDEGIYRSVKRLGTRYQVRYSKPGWWQIFKDDDSTYDYVAGDTVFCFAAVFAPTALKERIEHHWQKKNAAGDWTTTDRVGYPITGGRDGGWRGYTFKRNVAPGEWRVEVRTQKGRLLGRIPIEIREVQERPREFVVDYR